jgi:hypothetical protein
MEIQIKDISKILIYRLSKNGGVTYQVPIGAVDNEMVYEFRQGDGQNLLQRRASN